jgi:hypothetical protein
MTEILANRQWKQAPERRSLGRTKISRSARLLFNTQRGPVECGVRDITNVGAGIRVDGINVVPVAFELSFDNFRTARSCQLVWRDGDFIGVAFRN